MLKKVEGNGKLCLYRNERQVLPLANLKFQDVIGFYQANNDAVYKDMKTAYLGGKLTPFVGAGLSVFCGYKLWPSVLKELSEFIPDEGPKLEALEMTDQFKYLEAAEHIQKHYSPMLRRLQGIVSYDKLEACPDERLYSSAVWILPYLFHNRPLMTTNFDGVLEYVFSRQGHAFERMVEPHDPSMLTQIRQQDIHGLFKLHGDIGRETTSLDRLVFTKSQYDAAYFADGQLMEELKQWYQNQTLLFLGCSLSMDKTMEVLRDVVSHKNGIRHFAIVGCKPGQRSELLDRFGELGIDAIFYDDSNHDAVRVILENLLYETNSDAYQRLDDEMRRFVGPVKRDDILMYNAGRIKYTGRSAELAALERFCSSTVTNEWWAVTGPGGMGKSRLIYEFTNQKQLEGWQIRWLSRDQYGQLATLQLPAENTIVVLDDVQADTQTAGTWLNAMRTHRRVNRLRILMIERDGTDYGSADWLRVLRSGNPYADPLAQWCHHKTFLHLEPLADEDLKEIMGSCAEVLGKSIDSDALLAALERVDGELRRPLYALAIAEAACNGEDPLHWDPVRVLDEMLDRELAFHYESLQYILREQPTASLQEELELLMAQCCIRGYLPLDAVTEADYPCLTGCMARMNSREFFRCLGLLHTKDGVPVLRMNCPDLIKEHLVLRLAFERGTLDLLPDGWHSDYNRLRFLFRLWFDCPSRLNDQPEFWHRFLSAPVSSGFASKLYGLLLWGCTVQFPAVSKNAVDILSYLYQTNSNSGFAICYANGLRNHAHNQTIEDCIAINDKLEDLCEAHRDVREIAVMYAEHLCYIISNQPPQGQANTIKRLKTLYHDHSGITEIAVQYCKGLIYLFCELTPKEWSPMVGQLEELYIAHSDNQNIAECYSACLVDLALEQSTVTAIRETLSKFTPILERYSRNPSIQCSYAMTWFNLTLVQKDADIPTTVFDIAAFLRAHPDAIPEFKEALDKYLSEHPDHTERYRPLMEL